MRDTERRQRKRAAVLKEMESVRKQEQRLAKAAGRERAAGLSGRLEQKIPGKMRGTLEKAFCRAFGVVFEKGTRVVEKGCRVESLKEGYAVRNFSVELRGTRRELRRMKRGAELAGMGNLALAAVEGVGLGALGIGLPDIVLFLGVLLKGVYETALRYGFDYDTPEERLFILKLLEASVSTGADWSRLDAEADMAAGHALPCGQAEIRAQMERTAAAFAADMLLLKAIQGLPLVGILGGLGNPVYYNKVMRYAGLKYRKRYLQRLEKAIPAGT